MMMKKRSNKGMALATTLITMTIVLMLSALMLTVSLHSAHLATLSSNNAEQRAKLDMIGAAFAKNPETFSAADNEKDGVSLEKKVTGNRYMLTASNKNDEVIMKIVCQNNAVGGAYDFSVVSWNYGN